MRHIGRDIAIFSFFVLIFSGILAGSAFAAVDSSKVQELDARYNYIECRVNLVQSQAGLLSNFGTISTDNLTSDATQLKALADAGDPTTFNAQVQTLNNDFKKVNDELKSARQSFSKSNITQNDKDALKSQWNSTLVIYQSCNVVARREIVSVRIVNLQASIDNWNIIIANMTAKGLNTTELTSVVSEAQNLLSTLNATVQAADDATFKNMLDNANDEQNHLWARFAIGRIEENIGRIKPIIGQSNLSGDLNQINSLLNSASVLATPGIKYSAGGFQQTWQDIKVAGDMFNKVSKDLRNFEQAARQGGRFGNNTNPRNFTNFTQRENMTNRTRENFTNRPPRGNMTGQRLLLGPRGNQSGSGGDNSSGQPTNTQGGVQ